MMPDEKAKLLEFLGHAGKWCRRVEAIDSHGIGVHYDDDTAVAWDITGALCLLFGWNRACVLFAQIERHLLGKKRTPLWPHRDTSIEAMVALQNFNDRADTTFDVLRERIGAMPVWTSGKRGWIPNGA